MTKDVRFVSGELKPIWVNRKHSENTKEKISEKAKERIGEKNSQYGSFWVTNGFENKKLKKGITIPDGWKTGRVIK